jgi:hypothetical protein
LLQNTNGGATQWQSACSEGKLDETACKS